MKPHSELALTGSVQATIEDAERKNDLSFMKKLNKLGIQLGVVTIARTKIGTESPSHYILNNTNLIRESVGRGKKWLRCKW